VIAKKRRGPVPTGKGQQVVVRMQPAPLADLDSWIKRQKEPDLSRPEAIRRLVELGLTVKAPKRPSKPGRMLRAQELAAKAIDKIVDPAAPPEERAERKRRLTKGPEEFREARINRPKAKGK
jgi:hypothetical protein